MIITPPSVELKHMLTMWSQGQSKTNLTSMTAKRRSSTCLPDFALYTHLAMWQLVRLISRQNIKCAISELSSIQDSGWLATLTTSVYLSAMLSGRLEESDSRPTWWAHHGPSPPCIRDLKCLDLTVVIVCCMDCLNLTSQTSTCTN